MKKNLIGYIPEVGIKYFDDLHKLHSDYPLVPEKLATPYDMLSDYCKKIADYYGIKVRDEKKIIPNLSHKTNDIVHYRNFQLYLYLTIKLTKIHRVLTFKQYDWMKNYINTEKRTKAINKFEKYFFKLIISSVYIKKMENLSVLKKVISVKTVKNEKDYLKQVSKRNVISQKKIFEEKLNKQLMLGLLFLN